MAEQEVNSLKNTNHVTYRPSTDAKQRGDPPGKQ
jgi:hypothetical protein